MRWLKAERSLSRVALRVLISLALLAGLTLGFMLQVSADAGGAQARAGGSRYMPPEPDKITAALIRRGVIPASASPGEKEAAVAAYLQLKLQGGGPDRGYNPLARKQLDANEEALNGATAGAIRGRKLGKTVDVPPSSPQFKPLAGTDKLLLILVEFSDAEYTWETADGTTRTAAGPLHNQIPAPDNSFDLWVPDFSQEHFEDMLFTPGGWTIPEGTPHYAGQHRGSMHDYYLEQSYGEYTVDGDAYGWFTVDKPEAYYGDDSAAGGNDNLLPGTTRDLIADAVAVINAGSAINWADYDLTDPYDLDEDGVYAEPDGTIDHPLFIHAGIDQSGGGGAQGDDAIWAHSSSVEVQVAPADEAHRDGIWLRNYTIMPEDGGVGVFAHEFGHDLGLPDEYDTIYSGRGDSVAFWSLMSSGSWIGRPAQTQPSDISIWGRYALGWLKAGVDVAVTHVNSLGKDPTVLRLEQAERWGGAGTLNAVRINLPPKPFYVNTPYSGSWEWFGGKADQIDTKLRRTVDLTGKSSATLSFWTWYDIEPLWDFGFVQVSTDGGSTWTSLPIEGTTSEHDPSAMLSIVANLPGFTGNSGGWVHKTYDLAAYLGQPIELQFRYMTDWGTTMAGFYLDDISVTADGAPLFFDDVEALDAAWTAAGWTREQGSGVKDHYYMLEWRNLNPMETPWADTTLVNFDAGLGNAYSFDAYGSTGNPNEPWYFPYSPGLLLWYRDMTFTDNWIGAHPGGGFLLVVDAHDRPLMRPPTPGMGSLPWFSRVQSYDATFGLDQAPTVTLGYWGLTRTYTGAAAVPSFDDTHSYWSSAAPSASVKTPTYGLVFRVLGRATDGSAALIGVGRK